MANNNRDVKLTISAQDRASRDLRKITDALDDVVKSQEELAKSGKGLAGTLATDFKKLATQLDGMDGLARVAKEIDTVSGAQKRLTKDAAETQKALNKANTEYATAAKTTADLRTAQEALENAQKRDADSLKQLKEERRKYNDELKRTKEESKSVLSKSAIRDAAKAGIDTSSAQVAANRAIEDGAAKVAEYDAKIKALTDSNKQYRESIKQVKTEVGAAASNQERLRGDVEKLSGSLERTQGNVRTVAATLKNLKDGADGAAKALGLETLETVKLGEATDKTRAALEKTVGVQQALGKFSTGKEGEFASPKVAAALRSQRDVVEQAKVSWQLLNTEMRNAEQSMRGTGNATAQQAANLRSLANASAAAGKEYKDQVAELTRLEAAMGKTQNTGRGLRGMFSEYYGESRKAMSITQRLRGEILSLATGFLGLYAAMGQIKGVIAAYQSLEAAQNRLGVVFQQDTQATSKELAWLERQAGRLGISFKTLSDEYSKFAVAAKAANWEGQNTRRMFLDVAEAARVNKLSTEQTSGVFLALTQMISKGKVSSEELRRQLGDRMAGAFNLFAQALGMTTAELDEAMQKGEVFATESNLLKFGERLREVYGPQLAEALTSFTTEMGKMENNIYQSQLRIAKGGFIDALKDGMAELNKWFDSKDGREFFLELGAAMGSVVKVLSVMPQYFGEIGFAIKGFMAFKVASWFTDFANGALKGENAVGRVISRLSDFRKGASDSTTALMTAEKATATYVVSTTRLGTAVGAVQGRMAAWNTSLSVAATRTGLVGGATTAASVGLRGLGAAFNIAAIGARGLLAAFGGLTGLAIGGAMAALTYVIGDWATGVDAVTKAMEEHERVTNKVVSAYEQGKGKAEDWRKSIEGLTLIEAEGNFRDVMKAQGAAVDDFKGKLAAMIAVVSYKGSVDANLIRDFVKNLDPSKPETFKDAFEKLNKELKDPSLKEFVREALKAGQVLQEKSDAADLAAASAVALGTADKEAMERAGDLDSTMERLTNTTQDNKEALEQAAAEGAKRYADALDTIKSKIPGLADELKKLKELADLNSLVAGLSFDQLTPELVDYLRQAQSGITSKYTDYEAEYTRQRGTSSGKNMESLVAATTKLAEQLGVSAKDLMTVFSYETGGTFDPWQKGPTTKWGEHRGLIQMGEPQRAKYGYSSDSSMDDKMKAVGKYLVDAGVKAGDGLLRIYSAVNAGNANISNRSDAAAGGMPGTTADKVGSKDMAQHAAKAEGALKAYAGTAKEAEKIVASEKKITQEKEKQAEKAKKDAEKAKKDTQDNIADYKFQNEQQQLINDKKGRQAAIEAAIREERKKNPAITAEEIKLVEELVGKNYDLKHAQDAVKDSKKAALDLDKELKAMATERNAIVTQRDFFAKKGDDDGVREMESKLTGVNTKIEETITKLREMWKAVGGPDAVAGLAYIDSLEMKIQRTGEKATISATEIAQMASTGITNAFKTFAQAVANGENAFESLGNAFRQFAADFLLKIAEMIMQAIMFKAISAALGFFGLGGGVNIGLNHDGGVVGRGTSAHKTVNPLVFGAAVRYHTGGIAGLAPDEVPAILQRNEEVLTANDPRHRNNGGLSPDAPSRFNIVNAFDFQSFLSSALNTEEGVETILNVVRTNSAAFSQATRG